MGQGNQLKALEPLMGRPGKKGIRKFNGNGRIKGFGGKIPKKEVKSPAK